MRSAIPPQPGVHLGDDPDPAAELGQRMAATAQTAQGLLTNYLFYGQRRQHEAQQAERHERRHDGAGDVRLEAERNSRQVGAGGRVAPSAHQHRPARTTPAADGPTGATTPDRPRLHLRLVRPNDSDAPGFDPLAQDGLAADVTAKDPLTRDGLTDGPTQSPGASDPGLSTGPEQPR